MHFDGSFRCAQRVSDLLVGLAANQLREDFLLTRCKAGKKRAQSGNPSVLLSHLLVPDEGAPDRLQQFLFQYRFGKEVFRARLDRLHRHRNVAMTGYEDDGQPASELGELPATAARSSRPFAHPAEYSRDPRPAVFKSCSADS